MGILRELFSDNQGNLSSLRVMAMISLLAAIGLAFTGHDSSVLVFVGCSFGSKVGQKMVELNGSKTETQADK